MEILDGKITRILPEGIVVFVPYANTQRACLRQYSLAQVGLPDGRTISPEQRRKAHACIGEIAAWMGDLPEYVKQLMKLDFVATRMKALEKRIFSLSDCDVTLAREFITYLIDFMVAHEVPSKVPLYELCEDIRQYVYACLMHKTCAVCGKRRADLHHVERVGMGRNRDEIYQIGMPVISLCRTCHGLSHQKGDEAYLGEMHLEPIPLTVEIGRVYKLTKKNLNGGTDK